VNRGAPPARRLVQMSLQLHWQVISFGKIRPAQIAVRFAGYGPEVVRRLWSRLHL